MLQRAELVLRVQAGLARLFMKLISENKMDLSAPIKTSILSRGSASDTRAGARAITVLKKRIVPIAENRAILSPHHAKSTTTVQSASPSMPAKTGAPVFALELTCTLVRRA